MHLLKSLNLFCSKKNSKENNNIFSLNFVPDPGFPGFPWYNEERIYKIKKIIKNVKNKK